MNRDERLKVRRQKQNARADERQKVIDLVLEIIDEAQTYKMAVGSTDLFIDREALRDRVLDLKGGEQG